MTEKEARTVLKLFFTAFPYANKDIKENTIKLYIAFLGCVPYQIGQAAALKIIGNSKFFPTITEIKEAVNSFAQPDNNLPSPEDAWEEVRRNLDPYHAPKWSCSVIEKAVKVMGYRNLCVSQYPGHDREQFMRIYGAYRQREQNRIENESIREMAAVVIKQLPGGITI